MTQCLDIMLNCINKTLKRIDINYVKQKLQEHNNDSVVFMNS